MTAVAVLSLAAFVEARLAERADRATQMRDAVWPQEVAVVASLDTGPIRDEEPMGSVTVGPQYAPKDYVRVWNPGQVPGDNTDVAWRWHESAVVIWSAEIAARVSAEVEALRAIVAMCAGVIADDEGMNYYSDGWSGLSVARSTLRHVASIWRDHPDYRAEWVPR